MMQALNAIYKVKETRGFIETNGIAILFTLMAIVVFLLAIALLVVMPAIFNYFGFPPLIENLVRYLRWPCLAAAPARGAPLVPRACSVSHQSEARRRAGERLLFHC